MSDQHFSTMPAGRRGVCESDIVRNGEITPARDIDDTYAISLIERYAAGYQKQIRSLAPLINRVAAYIPSRRKRKLHVGLFGYSRNMGGVSLPRAITVTAALYSIGIPPEVLGLSPLTENDRE